jgi:hypothetical protein
MANWKRSAAQAPSWAVLLLAAAWFAGGSPAYGESRLVSVGGRALHPQFFLIEIFRQEQALVMAKLGQQAADRGRTLSQLLDILNGTVPGFASLVSDAI